MQNIKAVWKLVPLFRRPFQLKISDRHEVKTFGQLPNPTATSSKPIRCWKSRPNPKGSPKRSLNWFITNSTISAHRLPRTMQKAKPYGRPNTKHGAESVTKPFQTTSKPTSRSASKVSTTTKKAGCTTTVSGITTLKSGGLWVRTRLGWWEGWICLSMHRIRRYGSIHLVCIKRSVAVMATLVQEKILLLLQEDGKDPIRTQE